MPDYLPPPGYKVVPAVEGEGGLGGFFVLVGIAAAFSIVLVLVLLSAESSSSDRSSVPETQNIPVSSNSSPGCMPFCGPATGSR